MDLHLVVVALVVSTLAYLLPSTAGAILPAAGVFLFLQPMAVTHALDHRSRRQNVWALLAIGEAVSTAAAVVVYLLRL